MKFCIAFIAAFSALLASSFPAPLGSSLHDVAFKRLASVVERTKLPHNAKRFVVDPNEPLDISGEHAFQAPSKNDQRGPCPGLNALANHKYISHDGITSYGEVVTAINQVFGMGIDLALILGAMGTIWTGNPLSLDPGFSIGGTVTGDRSDNILGNLVGLLGNSRGLEGSHNWIESDSSLTRDDLYVTGNAWTMNMTLFRNIYDRADDNGVISMDLLADQAARRWQYSVSHNPNFYYGPVTGMVSRNAGYLFLGRLLSNHTEDNSGGVLTKETFKRFFAVDEDAQGNLVYREGHETFPENWFRRPSDYGLVSLNLDIVSWVMKYPELGSIGGNTGTIDSFSGLNLHSISGGIISSASLLQGNNLLCFVFEVLKTFLPNSLLSLLATLEEPLNLITLALKTSESILTCPAWQDLTQGGEPLWDIIQQRFPGASKAGSSL